ncbi:coatomer subunit zeta-1 [Platysternon megacephalum]|uniref:Coatomer subunit zeta-1 n=1 Tax=Platysternon megacephalum TaxID=55544 RepID=A0A4D9DZI1_9SAUR|nr:coatomer subunit zeta-1 [Platysternon megacephalum]
MSPGLPGPALVLGLLALLLPGTRSSYKASNNTVLEQHKKKKIKSRPYYVSQFQNKPFTITSFRSSSFPRGDLRTRVSVTMQAVNASDFMNYTVLDLGYYLEGGPGKIIGCKK